jgi:phosphatidylglycerophosphatase A
MQTVKESSDELNPPSATAGAFIADLKRKRTGSDYLALAVATWGVGYAPLAPGTFGSAVGVGIYLLVGEGYTRVVAMTSPRGWSMQALESTRISFLLVLIVALTAAGIWAATRAEKLLARKDPGVVVVDEVVGQLITFLFVPLNTGWWAIIVGFIAFRFFDIVKPYPARRFEMLESGLGIMADDVMAGVYAAILMSLLVSIHLWL